MNTAILRVTIDGDGQLAYRLRLGASTESRTLATTKVMAATPGVSVSEPTTQLATVPFAVSEGVGPLLGHVEEFVSQWRPRWLRHLEDGSDSVERLGPVVVRTLFSRGSADIVKHLRLLSNSDSRHSRWALLIHLDVQSDRLVVLARVPWEILPDALGLTNLCVVRLAPTALVPVDTPSRDAEIADGVLCAIGGPTYRGAPAASELEASNIAERFKRTWSAQQIQEVRTEALLSKFIASKPNIAHIATPAVRGETTPEILLGDDAHENEADEWVAVDRLGKRLAASTTVRFAMLSGTETGPAAARTFAVTTDAITLGWFGRVTFSRTTEFSTSFYDRLATANEEQKNPAAILCQVLRNFRPTRVGEFPVLWVPSEDQAKNKLPFKKAKVSSTGGLESGKTGRPVSVKVPYLLSPSLVTSNRGPLVGITLHQESLPDHVFRLQIACDTGMGQSTCTRTIYPSSATPQVSADVFRFPALHELVRSRADRRDITFTTRVISQDDHIVFEETQAATWLRNSDWIDDDESWPFLPAYVVPQSAAVKDVLAQADKLLTESGGRFEKLNGYGSGSGDRLTNQLRSLFLALQAPPVALKYIGPGSPVLAHRGDSVASGQVVRLADEVVGQGRGTCLDISLLLAALAEHIGIRPIVLLQHGHAFVGFWRSEDAYFEYWDRKTTTTKFGDGWTITDVEDLIRLSKCGATILLDATDVTRPPTSFEEACAHGVVSLKTGTFQIAVDVVRSRHTVQPL